MPGDLYAAGDVYISLHRSEGYGLNIAEALRSGMPTIATGWSLAPELAADAMLRVVPSTLVPVRDPAGPYAAYRSLRWAEPDIGVAAAHLHALCRP
jgi:glycosyltransferase involved in cell wall biosynthesis